MGVLLSAMLMLAPVLDPPAGSDEPKQAAFALFPIEAQLAAATNAERARYGLQPLAVDPQLIQSARQHAYWMANNHALQHTSAAVAENIAMGQRSAGEAIQSWMTSPGHRANMLNPGYQRLGVAAYVASDGTVYWCQQFLH